jgi:RnfABCDGE-type electron transport complex B subunit
MDEAVRGLFVLGSLGLLFSGVLAFLGGTLKVEDDPLVQKIVDLLPGINCGACGFSGCKAFAESLAGGGSGVCKPAGEAIHKKIAALIDVEPKELIALRVICRCGADQDQKKNSHLYLGPQTCAFAHTLGAALDCKYGCMGLGDCVKVCPTQAISIHRKKVSVDIKKCIGCGNCLKACPRKLFEFIPLGKTLGIYSVSCNNKEKAGYVKDVCSRGCISCTLCAKVEQSPFYIKDNLSYIDYDKLKEEGPLREAKEKCPTHCIDVIDV